MSYLELFVNRHLTITGRLRPDRQCRLVNDTMAQGVHRAFARTEKVTVVAVQKKKQSVRVDVEFEDDRHENIPGGRLRGLWADVDAYDDRMRKLELLRNEYELLEPEDSAASYVFELLVPESIATIEWDTVRNGVSIRDVPGLEDLLHVSLAELEQVY